MELRYNHTQIGHHVMIGLGIGCLVILALILLGDQSPIAIFVLLLLLITAMLFGWLTIRLSEDRLTWSFGIGLVHKSVRIDEIERVSIVRNHWLYGWGIRLTPHGWLYNVSGLAAVEVRLKNGKQFRLGTDQPEELSHVMETAMAGSAQ